MLRLRNLCVTPIRSSVFMRAGENWRVSQGLPRSGNESGELHDASDWSYADGTLPPITTKQKKWIHRRVRQRRRIQHLLNTAEIEQPKPTPILPQS